MMSPRTARQRLGDQAETLARDYLKHQGLTLRTQNFLCRLGEVDLIMQDGNTCVFVEVRLRRSDRFGGALASVTRQKQQRLIHTANFYLQHEQLSSPCRFDVITLVLDHEGQPCIDQWIRDAFQAF
ncbi:YraN family protein [Terasakiispira papahanaumokuakeensis]|uniref:UPF0102 protein BFW38_03155 n=1 Tax=Terasakiispira papahanaumokuakeensis TaxID=197479 RepID=A0A1E2V6S8_9GAMM|nr:YraN family protein [Terasakiispira papahanaumokuakeensis]ODC02691.1 YraN family protein [Terasakiispira papahanaumokuakeensis]